MDRFLALTVFVAVGEEQSFAAAARRLALSPPAVTRAVSALEQTLGVKLLHRTTRIVRLTEAGARYLLDCKRVLSELDDADQAVAGAQGEIRGTLAITSSVLFGRLFVAPLLREFLNQHAKVNVRALFVDRVVDLIDEGLDVAVRIAHLPDASFTAIRVGAVRNVVCASPAYLKRHGVPRTLEDLKQRAALCYSADRSPPVWSFQAGKRTVAVRPRARLVVNSQEVAIQGAIAGEGVTRVLSYQAASDVKAGRLRVILNEFEPKPIPIHVIHREPKQALTRVRAFVDFAVAELRENPLLKA
ncbi:MAG TPA: LysR substrate-binding domain-containing protein [Polyangiaceae bacterium]|nr:LysR substrate-binding domain-containing protein [Polyangiaceae bacterium]